LGSALLLAACGSATPPPSSGGGRATTPYLSGPSCVVALAYQGVAFNRLRDDGKAGACGVATAVSLQAVAVPLNRDVRVDCGLAKQLTDWVEQVVRPAARRHFGQELSGITHYGGYNCRGRTSNRSRLSEHAFGKAIDIAAFQLADGRQISVLKDWSAGGAKQAFLREVAKGSCPYFSVVLSPNSDADHANHLHLDIGPWKLCSS
jgi:hypothetical protein